MTSVGALKSLSIQLEPLENQGKNEIQEPQGFCERGEEPQSIEVEGGGEGLNPWHGSFS